MSALLQRESGGHSLLEPALPRLFAALAATDGPCGNGEPRRGNWWSHAAGFMAGKATSPGAAADRRGRSPPLAVLGRNSAEQPSSRILRALAIQHLRALAACHPPPRLGPRLQPPAGSLQRGVMQERAANPSGAACLPRRERTRRLTRRYPGRRRHTGLRFPGWRAQRPRRRGRRKGWRARRRATRRTMKPSTADTMANSNRARPPADCAHPSTRTRHRRRGRKPAAASTRGTPFSQRLRGLGTGPPRRHLSPPGSGRTQPRTAQPPLGGLQLDVRESAARGKVAAAMACGCGCWSSRTRSCAGTATSSGATGLHGPCAADPARPRAGIKALVSGWPGKSRKRVPADPWGVGRSGVKSRPSTVREISRPQASTDPGGGPADLVTIPALPGRAILASGFFTADLLDGAQAAHWP